MSDESNNGPRRRNPVKGYQPGTMIGYTTELYPDKERLERIRRNYAYQCFSSLIIASGHPGHRSTDPLLDGIRDADLECSHGSLPGDPLIDCDCWAPRQQNAAKDKEYGATLGEDPA